MKAVLPGRVGAAGDEENEGMKGMKAFSPGRGGATGDEEGEGMKAVKAVMPGGVERLGMKKVKE